MTDQPPLPQPLWDTLSPEAQAAVSALVQSFERRIAELEERVNKNSTNSSKPPSSDPPSVKRRPPAPASGKKRGGQPGHRRQARALVPPEQLRQVIECKPPECRWCGHDVARRRPRADPASGRRSAAGPAGGGRVPAPSPDLPPLPHLDLCDPAAGRAHRGVRPPAAGDPQRPGRGLPPGQAADPPAGLRPARPVDLHGHDLPGWSGRPPPSWRPRSRNSGEYVREAAVGPHRRDLVVAGPGQDVALGGRDAAW